MNSCTVKGPAEDGLRNAVRKGRELGKPLVVSGCVPQGQRNHSDILGLSVVGVSGVITMATMCVCVIRVFFDIQVQQIDRVVEVVEETLKG